MGACGAEGGGIEADSGTDVTLAETSVKDAPPDRTVTDANDASDASDVKIDTKPDVIIVPDATDAKPDVIDASDAKDADADADLPPEGSPCTTSGAVQARACGGCGTQERVCLDLGSGMKWQSWGSCKNEVVGGCTPGAVSFEECDLCGRRRRECTSACTWITGICENQNPNACEPGTVEWVEALSCDAGTGRTRTCSGQDFDAAVDAASDAQTGCTWSNYAQTCTTAPTSMNIPTTLGDRTGQSITLSPTATMPFVNYGSTALDGGCLQTTGTTSYYLVPFAYIELVNPTAFTATVSVWGTMAADSGTGDGLRIIAYSGAANPPSNLSNCLSQDYCYSQSNCKLDAGFGLQADAGEAGLSPYFSPKVTIPAGGKLVLLVSEYYNYSTTYNTLPILWVRTDELK